MEKNRHEEIFLFPDFQEINPKNKSTLKNNEEKKQSYHLNLLNKLTTESTKMSSKQKKSPEEIVKARLNSLLKNPALLLQKNENKEVNSKSVTTKEENQINIHNFTSEIKNPHLTKSPIIKTEPKETMQKKFNDESGKKIEIPQNNNLLNKLNEIKFNKFIMNKSINMSQNISPKILANNYLQKSNNQINQSQQSNANNNSQHNFANNTFTKLNAAMLNVGLIKNRKNIKIAKDNNNKFINLKNCKYKEFNPTKSLMEKHKNGLNSQTNENISINTSHNISYNSNQIHLKNENRLALAHNDENYSIISNNLDNLLNNPNDDKNNDLIIEIFEFLLNKHKNHETLILKFQKFVMFLLEDNINKSKKEQAFKELIEKLNYENERMQKDSHEVLNITQHNNKKDAIKNEMNSTSTNYTNNIHKQQKFPNSNISKENTLELKNLAKENQKLKNVILDQQNSLYQMKEKETKLIKLLQGVKKRGIDLDEIFREEIVGENTEKSIKENESEKGNLHLMDSESKEKYITEKSIKYKLQNFSNRSRESDYEIDKNQADESIINDSDESSFNYFGKPESIPTSMDVEINPQKRRVIGVKSNTAHFQLNYKIKEKLKLNLTQIKTKNIVQSSSDNQENKHKNLEKMSKIFQKKMSEQTHQNYKLNKYDTNEILKNIEEMGEIWKKIKK